jgi:hypothetical protein
MGMLWSNDLNVVARIAKRKIYFARRHFAQQTTWQIRSIGLAESRFGKQIIDFTISYL